MWGVIFGWTERPADYAGPLQFAVMDSESLDAVNDSRPIFLPAEFIKINKTKKFSRRFLDKVFSGKHSAFVIEIHPTQYYIVPLDTYIKWIRSIDQ